MPSDSIVGAVAGYIGVANVPVIGLVKVFRDEVPQTTSGGQVGTPYVVVREENGRVFRDMEGSCFGTQPVTVTVWADKAADARAVGNFILFAGQSPEDRAGIEAGDALIPDHLSGHSVGQAFLEDTPVEKQSPTRRADKLAFTYSFRLNVKFQRG